MNLRLKPLEIVGIDLGNNGRTCGIHEYCGKFVTVSMELMLRSRMISITEESRELVEIENEENTLIKRGRPKKKLSRMESVIKSWTEEVFEARMWKEGRESCLVGYVAKPFVFIYGNRLEGRIIEVTDLLNESINESARERSKSLNGIARALIMQ